MPIELMIALNSLKDTPVPTILVLGGISLLVLAFVQAGIKFVIAPSQKKPAIVFGVILLGLGIGLYLIPEQKTPEVLQITPTPTIVLAETPIVTSTATLPAATDIPTVTAIPPTETTIPVNTMTACIFYVYQDWGASVNHYVPEGFMGDTADIKFDENYKLDPDRPSVIQIGYQPRGTLLWAGVNWWDPAGSSFGSKDGGYDLSCATKLTFWARGEKGGEIAEFKVGGIKGTYSDSLQPEKTSGPIILTNQWVQYTMDLRGEDLSHILGGFIWTAQNKENPKGAVIYLDDIRFEQ
jgi:hypothetical protein